MAKEPEIKTTIVYGGERDWVDKTGAFRLARKYPQTVKIHELEKCGHNLPFHKTECI
jgi:pimeloyl-ACP methyl ester carboxylesterase